MSKYSDIVSDGGMDPRNQYEQDRLKPNTTLTSNQLLIAKEFEKDLDLLRKLIKDCYTNRFIVDRYFARLTQREVEYMRYIVSCEKENNASSESSKQQPGWWKSPA